MILGHYGATKWRKNFMFQATTCAWIYIGHDTKDPVFPQMPRIPMTPEGLPRVWVAYFREMHDILSNHINDLQRHRAK